MAVLKSKRGQSNMQFLENAYELEVYTIAMCRKFPKGLMFLITAEICRLAGSCHNNVKAANSVFPNNAHEAQMRRDYLTKANCDLQCLLSKLDIAKGLHPIETRQLERWVQMVTTEATLISAVKQADKKRYANLV